MVTKIPGMDLRRLGYLLANGTATGLTDAQLLDRFLGEGDAATKAAVFEVLVVRHGPMVLATCLDVLRHEQDVEDAFQATFLVLAKKARTIRAGAALGGWLHRVAYRASVKASVKSRRRRRREAEAATVAALEDTRTAPDREVASVVHEELDRLPDRHRLPVVLCDLQGISQAQAASELGYSERALRYRLKEAHDLLKDRLTRRGLAPTDGMLASYLTRSVPVVLPSPLVQSTVQAATVLAAGQPLASLASAHVASLTQGVSRAMFLTSLKTGAIVLAFATGITAGAVAIVKNTTQLTQSPAPRKDTINSIGMKLVRIQPGKFTIGSSDGFSDEKPPHPVTISRSFDLGVHEVSQRLFELVMGENLNPSNDRGADLPVEQVTWLDAVRFCNKLSERAGLKPFYEIDGEKVQVPDWNGTGYRLPTEAEWEYACRAGTTTKFSSGNDVASLERVAWCHTNSRETHPVGQKPPNPWGLHDLHGNVWEWVWDWYNESEYKRMISKDPIGPKTGTERVLRGGGFQDDPEVLRSAKRYKREPSFQSLAAGFRVARNSP